MNKLSNKQKYNKKATMLSRMGFQERDLKNATHDELCIWLAQDEIQKKVFRKYIYNIKENVYDAIESEYQFYVKKAKEMNRTLKPIEEIREKLRENIEDILITHSPGDWEYVVQTERGFYLGFIDLHRRHKFYINNIHRTTIDCFFEVKISNQPIGEILRQLNIYRQNLKSDDSQSEYFVVCEDDSWLLKYKEIIEDNGWNIFTPNDIEKDGTSTVKIEDKKVFKL